MLTIKETLEEGKEVLENMSNEEIIKNVKILKEVYKVIAQEINRELKYVIWNDMEDIVELKESRECFKQTCMIFRRICNRRNIKTKDVEDMIKYNKDILKIYDYSIKHSIKHIIESTN